jgi:hypothetical protein
MLDRDLVSSLLGAGLLAALISLIPGCSEDPKQPARESISAPRKGGGVQDPSVDGKAKGVKAARTKGEAGGE